MLVVSRQRAASSRQALLLERLEKKGQREMKLRRLCGRGRGRGGRGRRTVVRRQSGQNHPDVVATPRAPTDPRFETLPDHGFTPLRELGLCIRRLGRREGVQERHDLNESRWGLRSESSVSECGRSRTIKKNGTDVQSTRETNVQEMRAIAAICRANQPRSSTIAAAVAVMVDAVAVSTRGGITARGPRILSSGWRARSSSHADAGMITCGSGARPSALRALVFIAFISDVRALARVKRLTDVIVFAEGSVATTKCPSLIRLFSSSSG